MTAPVSSNYSYAPTMSPAMNTQPIGAFGIGGNKELKAGSFVVNPPVIRPYTFYDKIKVDPDFYRELVDPKSKAFYHKKTVQKNRLKGILKAAALVGGVMLAVTYRKNIQRFLSETLGKIKNMIKK